MAIINRIKAVLAEKQLTSNRLAEQFEKSENAISMWCSNIKYSLPWKVSLR